MPWWQKDPVLPVFLCDIVWVRRKADRCHSEFRDSV
jgi:hypothetical protein